ncbi:MAG: PHP domain-containing protein [Firmicutes bacterium]|nr:PHP domain-containing protein [Bacillota bacterium]
MKIFADYHTHTLYSHGKGTIRDNVESAIKKGLREIAIADHGVGHLTYGVKKRNLSKIRTEIDALNKEYKEIKILMGMECNIISYDGEIDIDDEIMGYIDMLLVGFHFGAKFRTLKDSYRAYILNYCSRFSKNIDEKIRKLNTTATINAINRYDIDLITHPGAKVDIDTKELAKAAAKRGTALEINSSHGQLSLEYIKIAMEEDVNFIISSDAHTPEDVGNVEKGITRAIKAGLKAERILNAED